MNKKIFLNVISNRKAIKELKEFHKLKKSKFSVFKERTYILGDNNYGYELDFRFIYKIAKLCRLLLQVVLFVPMCFINGVGNAIEDIVEDFKTINSYRSKKPFIQCEVRDKNTDEKSLISYNIIKKHIRKRR